MKNLLFMIFAVGTLAGCSETVDRCSNGESSQEECCASDPKYCLADVGGDTTTVTDAGTDIEDTKVDAMMDCDPACTTGVCETSTKTCVGCLINTDCSGAKAFCDTDNNTCVACVGDTDCVGDSVCSAANTCVGCVVNDDCSGGTAVCDVANNTCVGCLADANCASTVCDTATKSCIDCREGKGCVGDLLCKVNAGNTDANACVACLADTNCTTAATSKCDMTSNACVGCTDKSQCGHILDANQCSNGKCVECTTATEDVDCLVGNDIFACDISTNKCSEIIKGSGVTCQPCVSSTSCTTGFACVPTTFGAPAVPNGNYCMKLSNGQTCPGPYGADEMIRNDINSAPTTVCMINEAITSCDAYQQYGKICTIDATACDGADGGLCKQASSLTRRCTYACTTNSDCKNNITCLGTATGDFCGATAD